MTILPILLQIEKTFDILNDLVREEIQLDTRLCQSVSPSQQNTALIQIQMHVIGIP